MTFFTSCCCGCRVFVLSAWHPDVYTWYMACELHRKFFQCSSGETVCLEVLFFHWTVWLLHMPIHCSRKCCWLRLRCYVVSVVCILYMMLYCLVCVFCLDVLRCLCFVKCLEQWKCYIKQTCCCCYNMQVMWSQHGGVHELATRFVKCASFQWYFLKVLISLC